MEDEAVKQVLEYNPWWTDLYSEMMTLWKGSEENFAALGKKLVANKTHLRTAFLKYAIVIVTWSEGIVLIC